MAGMDPLGAGFVFRHFVIEVTPGNFAHLVLRAHDHGELLGFVFLSPGPIANEGREESGEAIGLVRTGGLQMPAERLGAHIDTIDRLRIGAGRTRLIRRQGSLLRRGPQLGEQPLLVGGFQCFEPHRAMVRFGK